MQQLLATLPDPGPMPPDLVERITASLAAEQAHRSPLLGSDLGTAGFGSAGFGAATALGSGGSAGSRAPGTSESHRRGGPTPMSGRSSARRGTPASRGWLLGLSGAAAAAAIGGVAALNMLGPAGGHAGGSLAFGHFPVGSASSAPSGQADAEVSRALVPPHAVAAHEGPEGTAGSTPTGSPVAPSTHIQMSATAYTGDTLVAQAGRLWNKPQAALPPLSAESPAIGPIGTTLGVTHCLAALGVTAQRTVVDVARYDGAPAALVVTDGPSGTQVRVVSRVCGAATVGDPVLAGPMSLP